MKLYTEEQMKSFYELGKFDGIVGIEKDVDVEIKNYTPIELPSDEEIENWANKDLNNFYKDSSFMRGVKYVIDKIQGGNK